ncbi:tRNA (adenosine(37)-N6)-threonylcarbamoyltransferase complex ATPase subunit type 1 TsaE [Synechococcus sp. GreenBA-s]|nr:tRNA (adenosine(37)-N6)-threonylcarbamoyltransferase complex ATPase subunit type 1 TsaE [Synechococcus sp. GreenBA-s]
MADAAATRALGVELARLLLPTVGDHQHPGDASDASSVAAAGPSASVSPPILLLEGDLGAGKTCLVQGLAEALGIDEPITSPTFALAQHYAGRRAGGPTALVHLDLYRLEQPAAADELFAQEEEEAAALGALLAVEWPSRLSFVPAGAWRVALALAQPDRPEAGRRATIQRL